MKTYADIQPARVAALKTGDKTRAATLSLLANEVQRIAKEDGNRAPRDADVILAARRSVKRTQETLSFTRAVEKIEPLELEISVYEEFLPQQLSESQLTDAIKMGIASVGITSSPNIGAVMKYLRANHEGQYDPKLVKPMLDQILASI